jgi:hypothetical protein
MRQCLSVLLAWVLSVNSLPGKPRSVATLHSAQAPTIQKATLQEQVLAIPAGSLVEIRLKTKEKLRGRLVEVSNEAITVKVAKGDKIDERKLAFDELKSIKGVDGGSKAGKVTLYVLAGVGVGLVILFVIAAVVFRDS